MRWLVRLLLVLVVLAGIAVGVDRVAARVAAGQAAERLSQQGFRDPKVSVAGFPFLTQAARRRVDRVNFTAASYALGTGAQAGSLQDVKGTLRGVTVEGPLRSALRSGTVRAGSVEVTGRVPFDLVERQADLPAGSLHGEGGQLRYTRDTEVLGQQLAISVTASVRVDGGEVAIRPEKVELPGGLTLPTQVADALASRLRLRYPVQGLPAGTELQGVSVAPDGLRARVVGSDVVLSGG